MKKSFLIALFVCFAANLKAAPDAYVKETLFQNFKQSIVSSDKNIRLTGFTSLEQALYVDALWSLLDEKSEGALRALKQNLFFHYDLMQRLRVEILKINHHQGSMDKALESELENALLSPETPDSLVYIIGAHEAELLKAGHTQIVGLAQKHNAFQNLKVDTVSPDEVVRDLFQHVPETHGVKLYMFCRENRLYPCLMVMRDLQGQIVRNADGSLWTHKALAASARGLPSHITNGNTPAGVWAINSVMPFADEQNSFGKFRRLIIEFIPASPNENSLKDLLPLSSQSQNWWMPSVVARDAGRDLFRIHGTLKINQDSASTYYPFMRTSGCIAQRENTYDDVTYQDQRDLLDQMMAAMDLEPTYENEPQVRGILYLIEIDRQESAVTENDLVARGIQ